MIHAAKKWNRELADTLMDEPFTSALTSHGFRPGDNPAWGMPFGAIIAQVELAECWQTLPDGLQMRSRKYVNAPLPPNPERQFGDYYPGRFAWELKNVVRFAKPIPFRGMQQLFDVPDELVAGEIAAAKGRARCNPVRVEPRLC